AAFHATWRRRRADLRRGADFDVLFVQKGFFPGLYAGLETRLTRPFVFDFDDAIWLQRQGGSAITRLLHRESAVQRILRCATAVIAGNDFLAEYAWRFNPNVTVVPSTVDTNRYPVVASVVPSRAVEPCAEDSVHYKPVVGWIGSR